MPIYINHNECRIIHGSAWKNIICFYVSSSFFVGCGSSGTLPQATVRPSLTTDVNDYQYLIGPGDSLTIFVWRNPKSRNYIVRPDGKVTTSLVEDIDVTGRTPSMLAREIEEQLSIYINNPRVTVSVNNFTGPLSEQVRVMGEAANPSAVSYTEHMTLLDS